jgi:acyl-CoA thioesterase II
VASPRDDPLSPPVTDAGKGASLEHLPSILDLLDLEYVEENLYRCHAVFPGGAGADRSDRLYGGQVAAQALLAAGRTVPEGRLPHSLHGYFLRQGSSLRPTLLQVDRDRDGQSFSARRVVAIQHGEAIFTMSASFAAPRPGADRDAGAAPVVPPPTAMPAYTHPRLPSLEFRTPDSGQRLPGRFWVRCTDSLPEGPMLHAAVLAYTSDISTGLIPLEGEESQTGPSLDHAVWFHRPARMDGWTWQELAPHTVAGGRGWYTGAVFASDGSRIASIAQEALFRVKEPPQRGSEHDARASGGLSQHPDARSASVRR